MCRFVAYLGEKPIILNELFDKPENSLINQSRQAREIKHGLNADGFGIGWYEHEIESNPGLFKSTQPAWNDQNLRSLSAKIRSTCCVGHVRASTIGNVNRFNCHPFIFKDFLFCHNGTIRLFPEIRRKLLEKLTDETFNLIKGQTDSEHFFALVMNFLYKEGKSFTVNQLADAMNATIKEVCKLQKNVSDAAFSRLNTVLTDGKQLIATRYVSNKNEMAHSLYYSVGDYVDKKDGCRVICSKAPLSCAILVASEPLTDYAEEWLEVPVNHMLLVNEKLETILQPIS